MTLQTISDVIRIRTERLQSIAAGIRSRIGSVKTKAGVVRTRIGRAIRLPTVIRTRMRELIRDVNSFEGRPNRTDTNRSGTGRGTDRSVSGFSSEHSYICPLCDTTFPTTQSRCSGCGGTIVVSVEESEVYESVLPMCGHYSSVSDRPDWKRDRNGD